MRSRGVEGIPTNNADFGNDRLPPTRALGRARRPRSNGSGRTVTKQTKQNTEGIGPSQTRKKTKTKNIGDFGCPAHVRDNSNDELSSEHDDTSHVEAPSDTTYSAGDH